MRFYCRNCIILHHGDTGSSMRMVNTIVITLNIWMAIHTLSETDDSSINSNALLLVVMALL